MTEAQKKAFEGANPGGDVTVDGVWNLVSGTIGALFVVWCGWVVLHAYRAWSAGRATAFEAGGQVLRAFFLMVLVLFFVGF